MLIHNNYLTTVPTEMQSLKSLQVHSEQFASLNIIQNIYKQTEMLIMLAVLRDISMETCLTAHMLPSISARAMNTRTRAPKVSSEVACRSDVKANRHRV